MQTRYLSVCQFCQFRQFCYKNILYLYNTKKRNKQLYPQYAQYSILLIHGLYNHTQFFAPHGSGPQVSLAGPMSLTGRAIDTLNLLRKGADHRTSPKKQRRSRVKPGMRNQNE